MSVPVLGYMAFDSFTSNWQGELFSQYKMTSVQMMTGVNLFSCLFTSISLIEQGTFFENLDFMFKWVEGCALIGIWLIHRNIWAVQPDLSDKLLKHYRHGFHLKECNFAIFTPCDNKSQRKAFNLTCSFSSPRTPFEFHGLIDSSKRLSEQLVWHASCCHTQIGVTLKWLYFLLWLIIIPWLFWATLEHLNISLKNIL